MIFKLFIYLRKKMEATSFLIAVCFPRQKYQNSYPSEVCATCAQSFATPSVCRVQQKWMFAQS